MTIFASSPVFGSTSGLSKATSASFVCDKFTDTMAPSSHMCATVMRFCVKVPVLSEHIVDTLPSASTAVKFFTRHCFLAMRFAVNANMTVIVARRPSGTLDTMIPMTKTSAVSTLVPRASRMTRKITPKVTNRDSASVDRYLAEVGQKSVLLTADEEVELAKKIRENKRS